MKSGSIHLQIKWPGERAFRTRSVIVAESIAPWLMDHLGAAKLKKFPVRCCEVPVVKNVRVLPMYVSKPPLVQCCGFADAFWCCLLMVSNLSFLLSSQPPNGRPAALSQHPEELGPQELSRQPQPSQRKDGAAAFANLPVMATFADIPSTQG